MEAYSLPVEIAAGIGGVLVAAIGVLFRAYQGAITSRQELQVKVMELALGHQAALATLSEVVRGMKDEQTNLKTEVRLAADAVRRCSGPKGDEK